jgi:RES domain-containing protein
MAREKEAFSGEGARLYGGRWNHRGTAVVYVSESLSLAALELFVHLGPAHEGMRFATFTVEIPARVKIESLHASKLPLNWREEPSPDTCKAIGTDWEKSNRAAILKMPSVIVPVHCNYMLNVGHPDFKKLKIKPQPDFSFDPRMWKPTSKPHKNIARRSQT